MKRIRPLVLILFIAVLTLHAQTDKGVRVQFAAPQGATSAIDHSGRIIATFNEPMTALKAVPKAEGALPMKIQPSIRGTYRWLGTTTLAFTPADTLPFATRFTVTIPAGTRALSGSALKNAYTWTFETPRPAVSRMSPAAGQRRVELGHAVFIEFNQPVDVQTIGKWISLSERTASGTAYPAYSVRRPNDDELFLPRGDDAPERVLPLRNHRERSIAIIPSAPFKKGGTVTVLCKAGLPGTQGPLGMERDFSASFSTYDELKFTGVHSDDNFNPAYGLRFEFSNPVAFADVAAHLVMTPAVKINPNAGESYTSDNLYMYLDLRPETQYTGVVKAGLKDVFGGVLAADAPFTFRTTAYRPYVRMTTGPGILEAYEVHAIPVSLMNTDSIAVRMGALTPERIVPLMTASDFWGGDEWTDAALLGKNGRPAPARIWRPAVRRNTASTMPLEITEALGTSTFGIVYVQLKNVQTPDEGALKSVVQVTNIGLTAKFSPESILLWATHLNDASPALDADVEVRTDSNRVVWRGKTDARGLCSAPGWGALGIEPFRETYGQNDEYESVRPPRLWIIVKSGHDCAFTSSQWNEGIEPYAFGLEGDWNPQYEKYEGTVFTDRGLYKANEMVGFKGIVRVRREGAWRIAQNARTRVLVTDPRNEVVVTSEVAVNAYGSFSLRMPLKAAAPTGSYRINVEVQTAAKPKPRWVSIAGAEFRVEAFRPAEFEVTAAIDRDKYTIGDTLMGYVNARYLFGAPMKDAPLRWRFSLNAASFTPAGWETYYFGTADWLSEFSRESSHRVLASGIDTLDEYGSAAFSTPLRPSDMRGTVSVMLEGDATSASRQTLSGRKSVLVHGGLYYVGVQPSSSFLATDSALTVSLVTVTPEGVHVPGRSVTLTIHQRMWHSVRKAETGGRYAWQTETADTLVDSTVITTADAPVFRRFVPTAAGFYYITASSVDTRGNRLESQAVFYVSGSGYVAWERGDNDHIDVIADRTHYRAGDVARLIVKNPYETATALVSIEREGILRHYTTLLAGSAPQIDIPIEAAYLPNVFVSVVLLQGRIDKPASTQAGDIGRPSFKVGYVKLSVSPKEKLLRVSVVPSQPDYRPGDSVTVTVTVRNAGGLGAASEIALSVADMGVLNLINYHLPDPFDAFYRERGLAVTTTETRMHLIEQRSYGEKGEDVGGGGAGMRDAAALDAEGTRKDFRPSAYWNPSILTNDSGVAVVRFKLPDNITAFRAMAVAQTLGSEFGEGEASFNVSKPVLLQPSLPRFARVGDTFEAGVVVMNHTSSPRSVTVHANASGIRINGNDTLTVELQPGQAREITYNFSAQAIGTATVNATAVSGTEKDGLRWTFPVMAPRRRETVAMFNSTTETNKDEAIAPPENVFAQYGDVEFTAASTALVGLSGGMRYLFTYPYGCLEQRASSVLPMILAKDLVDAFGFDIFKGKSVKQTAQKTVDELPLFQKFNGGFAYWKTDVETSPYVSAYAVYTLLQAQRNGFTVDKRVLENGIVYLARVLGGEERNERYSIGASQTTRALIVYTLALAGKPDYGTTDKLFAERATLPLFAKAYVLKAAALSGKQSPIAAELSRDLMNYVKADPVTAHFEEQDEAGLAWIFTSTTRTTALILQALIETNTETDLIPKMVRWLLNAQRNGRWRTTQENVYVVDALASYFKKYEKDVPQFTGSVAIEGKRVLSQMFAGRSLDTKTISMPLSALPKKKQARVTLGKEGTGRLYYGMRMTYFPKGASKGRDEGVTVLRAMEPADGTSGAALRPGMLMKVTVSVIAHQDRNFLVVEDPVPAGCEVVSTSFATTASNLGGDQEYYSVFTHVERYDDRVALFADAMPAGIHSYTYLVRCIHAGTFVLPSTGAECMYEPEVFGSTASGTVIIR